MDVLSGNYKHTKTTEFMVQLNTFVFIFGLPSFWVEDLNFQRYFYKNYQRFNIICNICVLLLLFSELGAFWTQKSMTDKQTIDLFIFSFSQGIIVCYIGSITCQESEIKNIIYELGIGLKKVYNDSKVERIMIKRAKFLSAAFIINCIISFIMITLQAWVRSISSGKPFNAVISVFPDINDDSTLSNVFRAIHHIFWWINITRVFSVYTLVICITTAMSHQFTNLNSYFCSLNNIFTVDNNWVTHKKKEEKYEEKLKIGLKLHAETLKCTNQIQTIFRWMFSGQIIFNIVLLILLMYQMMNSYRSPTNAFTIFMVAVSIMCSTGFFMWNAGDITIEAGKLPTCLYCSGWENCYGESSKRVRKLIVIAMTHAQRPVVLYGLGIVPLSYQSFVSIVKSSYSVFSVLY